MFIFIIYRQTPSDLWILDNKQFWRFKDTHRKSYSQGNSKNARKDAWNILKNHVGKWLQMPTSKQHSEERACMRESSEGAFKYHKEP